MPIFADSKQNIFSDVLDDLLTNTNLTQAAPGTKTRALVEAVTNKIGDVWTKFDLNMAHAFLNGAEGKYLDYFGDMFGLQRETEKAAAVKGTDKIIRFYRTTGENNHEIPIPQGTIVSSLPNGTGTSYITTSYVTLLGGLQEVYAPARARQGGRRGNIGKGLLKYHDVNVASNVTSTLLVTNSGDITTGRGLESDDNFRFRIANQVLSAETANLTAIRMKALSVPGVADVEIHPFHRGIGTFDLLVKATSPSVPASLLNSVRQALYFVVAQGVSFNVRKPKETGVSMQVTITLKEATSDTGQQNLRRMIQGMVFDHINNLDIGESLNINEVMQKILSLHDNIKTMGYPGKPIDNITLYKETALSQTKIPETLFALGGTPIDYYPALDEKLLIELNYITTENPITVIFT